MFFYCACSQRPKYDPIKNISPAMLKSYLSACFVLSCCPPMCIIYHMRACVAWECNKRRFTACFVLYNILLLRKVLFKSRIESDVDTRVCWRRLEPGSGRVCVASQNVSCRLHNKQLRQNAFTKDVVGGPVAQLERAPTILCSLSVFPMGPSSGVQFQVCAAD